MIFRLKVSLLFFMVQLVVFSTGVSAATVQLNSDDVFKLPDGRKIFVERIIRVSKRKYPVKPEEVYIQTRIRFEFRVEGQGDLFIGVLFQSSDPNEASHLSGLKRLQEGVDYVSQMIGAEGFEARYQPTEFLHSLDFKGEQVHFVFSPRPMVTLRMLLADLESLEFDSVAWKVRTLLAYVLVEQLGPTLESMWRDGYVHFDLKPQNIVVSPEGKFYLIDFESLARVGLPRPDTIPFTRGYSAPETLELNSSGKVIGLEKYFFHPSYDAYAFGKTIERVLFPVQDAQQNHSSSLIRFLRETKAPATQVKATEELLRLVERLQGNDPQKRLYEETGRPVLGETPHLKKFAVENHFDSPRGLQVLAHHMGLGLCSGSGYHLDLGSEHSTL